jgi:hypothetical protein
MAIIEKKVKLIGSKGSQEVIVLFDSGASYSFIQPELAKKLGHLENLPAPKRFGTAEKGRSVEAKQRVSLDFALNGYTLSDEFTVVSGLSEGAIIGATTLRKWRMKLDFEHDKVIVDPRAAKLRLLAMGERRRAVGAGNLGNVPRFRGTFLATSTLT